MHMMHQETSTDGEQIKSKKILRLIHSFVNVLKSKKLGLLQQEKFENYTFFGLDKNIGETKSDKS